MQCEQSTSRIRPNPNERNQVILLESPRSLQHQQLSVGLQAQVHEHASLRRQVGHFLCVLLASLYEAQKFGPALPAFRPKARQVGAVLHSFPTQVLLPALATADSQKQEGRCRNTRILLRQVAQLALGWLIAGAKRQSSQLLMSTQLKLVPRGFFDV